MTHDYTAQDALKLILTKLSESNSELAARAQIAIDVGVDEVAEQSIQSGRGRKRKYSKREYRKNRPLTDAESIDAVLEVLEAHLIVHRRVVNSVIQEFAKVPIGSAEQWFEPTAKVSVQTVAESEGREKSLEIELVPESARRTGDQPQTFLLKQTSDTELEDLAALIRKVRELTRFED